MLSDWACITHGAGISPRRRACGCGSGPSAPPPATHVCPQQVRISPANLERSEVFHPGLAVPKELVYLHTGRAIAQQHFRMATSGGSGSTIAVGRCAGRCYVANRYMPPCLRLSFAAGKSTSVLPLPFTPAPCAPPCGWPLPPRGVGTAGTASTSARRRWSRAPQSA